MKLLVEVGKCCGFSVDTESTLDRDLIALQAAEEIRSVFVEIGAGFRSAFDVRFPDGEVITMRSVGIGWLGEDHELMTV